MRKRPIEHRLLWPCAAFLVATQGGALAAEPQVWRCGNAYSHQACAHGAAIDTQDGRTAQQQDEAKAQAERTRALADTLHRENAAREAQQRKEELARHRALLKEQAALQRAQRKTHDLHDKPPRQKKNQRPVDTRRVVQPGAPAPQR
ncbi:MAG: hypothetical protein ACP5NM_03365 [Thiomonas sp.]